MLDRYQPSMLEDCTLYIHTQQNFRLTLSFYILLIIVNQGSDVLLSNTLQSANLQGSNKSWRFQKGNMLSNFQNKYQAVIAQWLARQLATIVIRNQCI